MRRGFRSPMSNTPPFSTALPRDDPGCICERPSRIEGIGRPRVEPSFVPGVIDHMLRVPDAVSIAAMRVLSRRLGRRVGGSTGTNFVAVCFHAARMIDARRKRLDRHADLRFRRALCQYLLFGRMAAGQRYRPLAFRTRDRDLPGRRSVRAGIRGKLGVSAGARPI